MPAEIVTTWQSDYSPIQSLQSWRGKHGLAGRCVDPETKTVILNKLEQWAIDQFDSIHTMMKLREHYELVVTNFPPR